jgi:predicted nucleotidyltransferase
MPIVRLLATHRVDWVLTGSTVLAVYGGQLVPNDIDVTPALNADNLRRLSHALESIDAIPAFNPDWTNGPSMDQCAAWTPHPATETNLDHLFVTRIGMVDVPPRLCGTYDELIKEAVTVDIAGISVRVCALEEVMRRLRGRARRKDNDRASVYAAMEERLKAGAGPTGVSWLVDRFAATD